MGDRPGSENSGGGLDPSRWVELHGPAMFAFARLRLPSDEAAEEAVQEAVVAALKSQDSFDGLSSERTWLIGVLRYKVLDAIRRGHKGASGGLDEASAFFQHGIWTHRQEAWHEGMPADEARAALREALETLPDQMRQALILRDIDGLPGKTVCEILDVTQTNLWTLVHRAKLRLRAQLAERFGERGD